MEYRAFHGRHDQPGSVLSPPPVQRSRCRTTVVTVFRTLIALLALVMVVLTIAGQIVPFCKWVEGVKKQKTWSVWQRNETDLRKSKVELDPRKKNVGEKAFAVLSAILSVASCVLGFVYLGLWGVHEHQRRREMHTYRNAQRYAQEMEMIDEAGGGGGHGNARTRASAAEYLRSYSSREELYRKERMRQRVDRSVGIALFSTLLVTTLCCLITVAVMAQFYITEVADDVDASDGESAELMAGVVLFIAAIVLGVIAFVVLAMPFATGLYLCCPPSLEKVRTSPKLPRSDSEERAVHHAAAPVAYQQGYHNEVRFVAVQHGGSPRSSPAPAYAPYSPAEAHTMEPVRDEQMVLARDQEDHMAAPRTGGVTLQQYINNAPSTLPPAHVYVSPYQESRRDSVSTATEFSSAVPAQHAPPSLGYVSSPQFYLPNPEPTRQAVFEDDEAQRVEAPFAQHKTAAPLPPPLPQRATCSAAPSPAAAAAVVAETSEHRLPPAAAKEQPELFFFSSATTDPQSAPRQSGTRVPPRVELPPALYTPDPSEVRAAASPPPAARAEPVLMAAATATAPPPSPQQQQSLSFVPTVAGGRREGPVAEVGGGVRVAASTVPQNYPATRAAVRGSETAVTSASEKETWKGGKAGQDYDEASKESTFDIPRKFV